MARQEQDREDLLKEATALVERAELALDERVDRVIIGFRRDGCASLYFSADEAYHFNSRSQLRRAYLADRLLKAERGRLVALARQRSGGEVQLVRHKLTRTETEQLLARFAAAASNLRGALVGNRFQLIGQLPDRADVPRRMLAWLEALPSPLTIADRPHAR